MLFLPPDKSTRQHDTQAKRQISDSALETTPQTQGQCDRNQIECKLVNLSEGKVILEGIYHCFFASFFSTKQVYICFFFSSFF